MPVVWAGVPGAAGVVAGVFGARVVAVAEPDAPAEPAELVPVAGVLAAGAAVLPQPQATRLGDEIPMPGYTMRVERLDPGQAMVVRSGNHACRFFRSGCGRGPMPRCQRRSNSRAADTRSAP
jgi:hypothetical protein